MLIQTEIKQKDGKIRKVGIYDSESKIWIVQRSRKTHFMRKLRGWGLDSKLYSRINREHGLKAVIIEETDTGEYYKCNKETIEEHKIYKTFHPHRLQLFVPQEFWTLIDSGK